jgi:hypothetical protein
MRSCRLLVAGLILSPGFAFAGGCRAPSFDDFTASTAAVPTENLRVTMQPVAELRIPTGFSKVGALPSGSIGFGQHPRDISAVLGFETQETVSIHKKGAKPGAFMRSVFKGLDAVGCRTLRGFQLESEDYRLHAHLGKSAELFAFGKAGRHQFYLIRSDRPDFVLSGVFKNIDRAEFESILSTLVVVE